MAWSWSCDGYGRAVSEAHNITIIVGDMVVSASIIWADSLRLSFALMLKSVFVVLQGDFMMMSFVYYVLSSLLIGYVLYLNGVSLSWFQGG